ncbi:MAG TPA: S8 family peptidase [Terriglobales bacterium]|nr:S8 family peptidase [Terriglobales bacterium]
MLKKTGNTMLEAEEVAAVRRRQCWSATWGGRVILLCALMLSSSVARAGSPKMSKDLAGKPAFDQVDVIVQYTQAPTARHHQKVLSRGGTLKQELGAVKGGVYRMPASALADLAADPDVAYMTPDRPLSGTLDSSATLDYHTGTINAPYAWGIGYDGRGIGVAVIDSGIIDIPDLKKYSVVYSQNFVGNGSGSATDQYGHGTHVAGIIAGTGNKSKGPNYSYTFQGIADNVSLINLRVLDQNGQGTDSQVIAAIQTAISLKSTYNIRVINLSLGRPVYESYTLDPICQAVEEAWKAGIVVVVAAGNEGRDNSANTNGYGTITAPGNDPFVITVGAMNTKGTPSRADDVIASYSSKGPTLYDHLVKPDLVAPGNRIISLYTASLTLPKNYPGNEIPYSLYQVNGSTNASPTYYRLSGTSMAAPMVSGTVALMLQQTSALTPDQVKARLMKTAYKNLIPYNTATDPTTGQSYNSQADIFTVGAGYLDIQAALSNTDLAPAKAGSALSPAVTTDASGNIVLVTGSSVIRGGSIMWGNSVVWGTSVLWGTNTVGQSVLWGTSVCWGTSTMQGYSVLWGTSVLWGVSSNDAGEATGIIINGED